MSKTSLVIIASLAVVLALTLSSPVLAQGATTPLSVEECVKFALTHSPVLVSSAQSVAVAQAGLRQSRSSYSPQLTLNATAGVDGSSGGGPSQSPNAADLVLGMTFWRSGRQDSVSQSRAGVQGAAASNVDQRLSVVSTVSNQYYAVLATGELVGVAKAGVDSAEQHRLQVEKQIEAGAVAAVEIHTVADDLAQAQLSLIDARSNVRLAVAALRTSMGMAYTTDLQ
ncbi:MAG: TolC family protein, partial [Armatimonadota bacterium]